MPTITTLKDSLHDQIQLGQMPMKVIAEELGMSYSMLANASNPNLDEFNFPLRHLANLCRLTGRTDALDYINHQLGRITIDLPSTCVCHETAHQQLAACFKEFGEFAGRSASALADNKVTRAEVKEIEKELMEAVVSLLSYLRTVQELAL